MGKLPFDDSPKVSDCSKSASRAFPFPLSTALTVTFGSMSISSPSSGWGTRNIDPATRYSDNAGTVPVLVMVFSQSIFTTGMFHSHAFANLSPVPDGHRRCVDLREKNGASVIPAIVKVR